MKQTGKPARRSPQLLAAVLLALPGHSRTQTSKQDGQPRATGPRRQSDFYNQRFP